MLSADPLFLSRCSVICPNTDLRHSSGLYRAGEICSEGCGAAVTHRARRARGAVFLRPSESLEAMTET